MSPNPPKPILRVRSVFISDVHLGFKGCRAEFLLDFLRRVECQQIYMVGDIIDLWSLHRTFYWPQQHNDVLRTLLGKARHGTRVVYVPGNHDRTFRDYRVAVEIGIEDFLRLDLPGSKLEVEAMACGVPVAAYPVTGVLSDDLRAAALAALRLDPAACRAD